ncbi:uncharacterized protein, partial [Physcomitrium patens]|uniref:uncharacterized protein n=1 Tax=Physcomitrium patens TaxID=3218 RepID=UPI003CCCD5A7
MERGDGVGSGVRMGGGVVEDGDGRLRMVWWAEAGGGDGEVDVRIWIEGMLVHQQQARSGTPPLAATTALSQLSQSMQSMQQERGVQGSQHGGGGQQSGGFPGQVGGSGSQVVSGGGSQQSMVLGGGVGHGSSMQGKAGGVASQQGVSGVKADAQYSGHSLQNQQGQQQLMRPKLEVETEMELDQKQAMQQLRSGNNVGGTAEMQLQEALQRQQSKQIQAHLSVLQQQRVLQGLSEQHVRDMTSIQLQQLQQQQVQMQQQQANLLQSSGARKHEDVEAGVCGRRVMQYLYHQRHRPPDNNIAFWRNFVGEYFAANARKRWCVSQYGSGGRQPTGIFPQDVWHCEICGTNPGRGFETTVEVLPRLMKMKFDSGIQEELLFVDVPHEYRQASGHMVLKYGKAIQESVFEQLRVVREGQLRIVFSAEWKILSWEFCGRSHEELLPRRLIVPQVNQLVQISQKYQSSQNGGAGASGQEMQTNCHLFVTSARQLAKNLELPTVNDLGYTKRYVRCLQISEVVNSMKDLIDHSRDNGYGPMASLHKFPRRSDGSSRSMLRIAQVRALQEQQQEQEQEQRGQHEEQEEQQEQEEEQQQEELELQSLLAETNTRGLSGLQEHFEEENEVDGQGAEGLEEAISGGAEADPLSSFFESNSLAALQTSLQDSLESGGSVASHQSNGQNGVGGSLQTQQHVRQQQLSLCRGGGVGGSVQASGSNLMSSYGNGFPSVSGGGVSAYSRGDSCVQQNMDGGSVVQQQQQAQGKHHGSSSGVHQLLQEMMMN